MADLGKPLVVITGAAGNIGRSLAGALADGYRVVGLDLKGEGTEFPLIPVDLTKDESVKRAFDRIRNEFGSTIASVIHLAAYFDFSGEDRPLYRAVNVDGTRRLLKALQTFKVEQFLYSSTMLVHRPGRPGQRIDEHQPIEPRWAYPKSKAEAEAAIEAEHGRIPYVLLRLAGLYDEMTSVPTFAQQIARIYERELQSHLYSGSRDAGQAMLHRDDMVDAFRRAVDRRKELPPGSAILIGEPEAIGYDDLQDRLGQLIHGEDNWRTMRVPETLAAVGAWAQHKAEPLVPDAIDQGEEPFVRPFMTRMASDHYELDIGLAGRLLGWRPRHRLRDELRRIVARLKADPEGWYRANKITPPHWIEEAEASDLAPEALRRHHADHVRTQHGAFRGMQFINMALGTWVLTQPVLIHVTERGLALSEMALGLAAILFAGLSLSWRLQWARWATAAAGALVMAAPFLFWTTNAATYISDTLIGALIIAFAVAGKPEPGPAEIAVMTGPVAPPGWSYNPSAWTQRLFIILLAFIGLYVSRYLAAYQLEHIDSVWEPFFEGSPADPRNGTEEIITSSVSRAWPVSDAAVGAFTYALEILTGLIGGRRRWRTMPWLVILFGLLIVPLGVTSIFFIVIQPIVIGTWSTLALLAAAAMLIQIPYSLDEVLATCQFMHRRVKAGRNWLRVLLHGDTDETSGRESCESPMDEFSRRPHPILIDVVGGGVSLSWSQLAAAGIGVWLLFTRLTLGVEGAAANVDHLIGSLVLTTVSIAAAEVARPVRYFLVPLGLTLLFAPFMTGATLVHMIASLLAGLLLIVLSLPRGAIKERYGDWNRRLV